MHEIIKLQVRSISFSSLNVFSKAWYIIIKDEKAFKLDLENKIKKPRCSENGKYFKMKLLFLI
jgi:hypothetical protein